MRRVALSLLALLGCRQPTQITVVLTTDVPCDQVKGTTVTVGRLDELENKPEATESQTCSDGHLGALVVIPSGAKGQEVALRVVAGLTRAPQDCPAAGYVGCIVARRALRFIPHTPLTLQIPLRASCKDVPCGATETCVDGDCRPAGIDAEACATADGCDESSLPPSPDQELCAPRVGLLASASVAVEASPVVAWEPDKARFWISWLNPSGSGLFVIRTIDLAGTIDAPILPAPPVGTAPGSVVHYGMAQLEVAYGRALAAGGISGTVSGTPVRQTILLGFPTGGSGKIESPTGPPAAPDSRALRVEGLAVGAGRALVAARFDGTAPTPARVDAFTLPPLARDRALSIDPARALSVAWNERSRMYAVVALAPSGGTIYLYDEALAAKGKFPFAAAALPANVDAGLSVAASEDGFVIGYIDGGDPARLRLVTVDRTTGPRAGSIRLGSAPAFPRILGVDARGKITLAWLEQGDVPQVMLQRFDAAMRPTAKAACVTCGLSGAVTPANFGMAGTVDPAIGVAVHVVEGGKHVQRVVPVDCAAL